MTIRRNWTKSTIILAGLFVALVSIYQIIFFMLYEYGLPVHAQTIHAYKKKYDELNKHPYSFPVDTLSSSDYAQLIDINFTFRIFNKRCTHELLVVMIHSAPKNFGKRKTIRESWGLTRGVIVLFALGSVADEHVQEKLRKENHRHRDFVQGSFIDSYENLTYKHVMLFKYLIYHCPTAKYLLKTDDDIFINIPSVVNFLEEDVSPNGALDFLFCLPNYAKVQRSFRGDYAKWRLSFEEYPDKYHPPSCHGMFLIYSQNVIFKLYIEAQNSKYFWIDDVYVTGHLFKKLNLDHVDAGPFLVHQKLLKKIEKNKIRMPWPFLLSGPNLNRNEIMLLDEYVDSLGPPKSIIHG